jgi:hypothetical protein
LLHDVVNDGCLGAHVHVELVAPDPSLSYVAWTDGTVGRRPARAAQACASALAVGPVTGDWRMASGL